MSNPKRDVKIAQSDLAPSATLIIRIIKETDDLSSTYDQRE